MRGLEVCILHSGRAAQIGQRGGLRRRVFDPSLLTPIAEPKNASDLCRLLAMSLVELRRGVLDPRIATATGYLSHALVKTLEIANIEARLAALENQHEERSPGGRRLQ